MNILNLSYEQQFKGDQVSVSCTPCEYLIESYMYVCMFILSMLNGYLYNEKVSYTSVICWFCKRCMLDELACDAKVMMCLYYKKKYVHNECVKNYELYDMFQF